MSWEEIDFSAVPDGWELVNTDQLIRSSEERERNRQSEAAAKARWRARAEEAESRLAKVRKYADSVEAIYVLVDPCCVAEELHDILDGPTP